MRVNIQDLVRVVLFITRRRTQEISIWSVICAHMPTPILVLKGKENGKTIIRASISYTLYHWFICIHWLKYCRLNRKDRLKNMRAMTLEVAMLADVRGAYSAISSVNLCVTGPLWHQPSSLPIDVLYSDWSTKR